LLTVKRLIKNILSVVWLQYNDDLILQPDLKPLHLLAMAKARVAELVDAADSKSAIRKDVLVRFQSRAPSNPCISLITIDLQGFIILVESFFTSFFD
jgi:hypothetical protein